MSIRPIPFSDEDIKRVLDRKKTQIRKLVNPMPFGNKGKYGGENSLWFHYWVLDDSVQLKDLPILQRKDTGIRQCPFGEIGDHLYVQEKWKVRSLCDGKISIDYVLDNYSRSEYLPSDSDYKLYGKYSDKSIIRPAIYMPKWGSRILLEITKVRVERIQDISLVDCLAEGLCLDKDQDSENLHDKLKSKLQKYWDTSYKRSVDSRWDKNPYVWVIEFKVLHIK